MLGTVTATADYFERIQMFTWDLGYAVSADDAWLGSRGLRTMELRLKQHHSSALRVAAWLQERPEAGAILHPAFPGSPGHQYFERDFKGASGLFAFELKDSGPRKRAAFINALKLFGIGYSWGGYESLALPADPYRTVSNPPAENLVRLHIGLEDPDDLIADLAEALDQAGLSP
jgi:cystathionine beta-lyase